jgi:flagellar basal-body rod protein FlgB
MSDMFIGRVDKLLANAVDSAWLKQKVIANNVANVNTPNFKRSEVSFQDKLQAVLKAEKESTLALTHPKHIGEGPRVSLEDIKPEIYRIGNTSLRTDGNNVDMDVEMAKLAEVQLLHSTLLEVIGSRQRRLRAAINEGR